EPPGWLSLVDGGLFANNPAMCALVEARKHHPEREVLMVSLGTGELTRRLPWEEIRDWGVREWALPAAPLLGVIFDGVSDTVDHQVAHLLPEGAYFRFQVSLTTANDDLDDASAENLRALRLEAARLLDERGEELERLVGLLEARDGG
ncbi:MAG: patatin, partial [Actinomycetota bacterium]|nr:patatin [Actinomycetota bacterium]